MSLCISMSFVLVCIVFQWETDFAMNAEHRTLVVFVIGTTAQFLTGLYIVYYRNKKEEEHTYEYIPLNLATLDTESMKTQEVSVDFWAMAKSMLTYGALTALCWVMLRLFGAVFTLPRRMRQQQQTIQESLQELQRRFPDLNITEEDLINAEKELDDLVKEHDDKDKDKQLQDIDENEKENQVEETQTKEVEDKKTI